MDTAIASELQTCTLTQTQVNNGYRNGIQLLALSTAHTHRQTHKKAANKTNMIIRVLEMSAEWKEIARSERRVVK